MSRSTAYGGQENSTLTCTLEPDELQGRPENSGQGRESLLGSPLNRCPNGDGQGFTITSKTCRSATTTLISVLAVALKSFTGAILGTTKS